MCWINATKYNTGIYVTIRLFFFLSPALLFFCSFSTFLLSHCDDESPGEAVMISRVKFTGFTSFYHDLILWTWTKSLSFLLIQHSLHCWLIIVRVDGDVCLWSENDDSSPCLWYNYEFHQLVVSRYQTLAQLWLDKKTKNNNNLKSSTRLTLRNYRYTAVVL